jgi:hypothetical protein
MLLVQHVGLTPEVSLIGVRGTGIHTPATWQRTEDVEQSTRAPTASWRGLADHERLRLRSQLTREIELRIQGFCPSQFAFDTTLNETRVGDWPRSPACAVADCRTRLVETFNDPPEGLSATDIQRGHEKRPAGLDELSSLSNVPMPGQNLTS